MRKEMKARERMLGRAKEVVKDYLFEEIYNYKINIEAVAEMLWEEFGVDTEKAEKLAIELIDPVWDDLVTEVETVNQEARDYYREREEDYRSAVLGR